MKNLKYLLVMLIALTTTVSCVEDDVFDDGSGPIVTADVKLNEIMSTGDPDWIELYNAGNEDLDLSGYALKDSNTKWTIPNVTIPAGGHVTFDCDGKDENGSTSFKISSGGESISLFNPADDLIDEITTPDMAAQVGLTYGREIDGGDVWVVMSPTKGAPNSTVNNPPVIVAEPLTEFMDVYSVKASDADGINSVKLIQMINGGVQSIEMALVGDAYKVTVPRGLVGDVVQYYVVATDNTGLASYYPENGNNEPAEFTVAGGLEVVEFAGEDAGNRGDVTFTVTPYYPGQVDEIRLYYLEDGEQQDEDNGFDDKHKVVLTQDGDNYVGVIPAQETDDVIAYYLRVEYVEGTKTYYPLEEEGGDFNHDLGTTWPTYTVEAVSYEDVIDQTVTYTDGPLTSVVFPTNPVPGTDMNIVLAYTSAENIDEARIYFDVRDTPAYVKANKVKGEDDASFTQTGVTINLTNIDAEDENGDFSGNTSVSGTKVTFYVRIATASAEYYYGSDGSMYLDDTPGGGTTDESDAFKADPSLWNELNVQ